MSEDLNIIIESIYQRNKDIISSYEYTHPNFIFYDIYGVKFVCEIVILNDIKHYIKYIADNLLDYRIAGYMSVAYDLDTFMVYLRHPASNGHFIAYNKYIKRNGIINNILNKI